MVSPYALRGTDIVVIILRNPFAALGIGWFVTALMTNASATTSIAVAMVGAGIIPDVKLAIPIIMGSNIGTCVTNSLIAQTMSGNPNDFKRAFSAATLNDGFNLLTIIVVLPLEIFTHFMFRLSGLLTNLLPFDDPVAISKANFLGGILNPFTNLFILLDPVQVDKLSSGQSVSRTVLYCCNETTKQVKLFNILIKLV
jgi:solute carrier family 34 (sodium-dependent phosphate cotransporter)